MSKQIKRETVKDGMSQDDLDVSTVQTFAGGGGDSQPAGSPFAESDYADETPWPFETLVQRKSQGVHHEAYATLEEAKQGHAEIVRKAKKGLLEFSGVTGRHGTPLLTPEAWARRSTGKKMRLYIWDDPYDVSYGSTLLFVVAESLEAARLLAKTTAKNGKNAWQHDKRDEDNPYAGERPVGVDVDNIEPSRVVDLPYAEFAEWME